MKTLTNSTCTRSRIRIFLLLPIIGQFFSRDQLSLERGKIGLNIGFMGGGGGVDETIFNITAGFKSKFYSNRRVSEYSNKLFEEGCWKDF
jgi:hypothetical protein